MINKICLNDECKIKWKCPYYKTKYESILLINIVRITHKNCFIKEDVIKCL